jgi:hypothetical protein
VFNTTDTDNRFASHLQALKDNAIMTKIHNAKWTKELRWWVLLMLMRSTYTTLQNSIVEMFESILHEWLQGIFSGLEMDDE